MNNNWSFIEIENKIKTTYYNSEDDVIQDFLIPVLKRSKIYKRETYSFSSAIFSLINTTLNNIIKNDCQIRYIVGFELKPPELNAIEYGREDGQELIERKIITEFGSIEELISRLDNRYSRELYRYRLTILSYLIAKNQLKIKVGFVAKRGKIKNPSKFKFHPKVMIFEDFEGNIIVANGSTNESFGGLHDNEESFDVFKSWNENTKEYYLRHKDKFDEFWDNRTENIKTISIDTLIEKQIFNKYPARTEDKTKLIEIEEELTNLIEIENQNKEKDLFDVDLWAHQRMVIDSWFENKNRGIIKFATGAGKTKTALFALNELYKKQGRLATVISTPYQVLSEQWYEEIKSTFPNAKIILAYESKSNWNLALNKFVNSFNLELEDNIIIITVNKTFSTEIFQNVINKIDGDILLIADEVHHFGAEYINDQLSETYNLRIGLSATPERFMDQKGTKAIIDYFGKILDPKFSLKDSLDKGILSHYNYHPIIVELKKDEEGSYRKISNEIQKIWDSTPNIEDKFRKAKSLIEDRTKILNTASQKLVKLREILVDIGRSNIENSLIYCYGMDHLEQIASILFDLEISNARITSHEKMNERVDSFNLFKEGERQVLLAINCLDEGLDIPAISTGFVLASSSNPKQFIQRRGRLLRKIRTRDGKIIEKDVNIYDFISFPPLDSKGSLPQYEEQMVEKEFDRFIEFAGLAKNRIDAIMIINEYLKKIGKRTLRSDE
jgi:superfamily II DNA or RNA helicase